MNSTYSQIILITHFEHTQHLPNIYHLPEVIDIFSGDICPARNVVVYQSEIRITMKFRMINEKKS